LFALSELDTGARAPGGHAPAAHGSGSTLGAPVDLARGSPHAQWLGGPDREGDPGAIGRFLFLYAVRARLPERLDDVRRLGPRAAAARWAEEDEASERGRGDHADCIPTEALGRERARRLDRACERAQRAFAATREGLGPPAWPPMPWLALALASNAEAWDRLAGQPPTFWADLRLAGLPHDALATVLHRASQLQRHAGVTCVPPPARLALAEARVRLLAAMEVGVWLLLVGEPAPRSDPDPPPGTRPGSARDAVDPAPTHLETAYVDGPLPPVAPPPDVARMDGPPPPVAGPPGVARVDGPPPPVAGPPGVARVDSPPPPVAGPPGVAHMDGPPPPVAGPPGVAHMDSPPPPVAGPPGVARVDGPPPPVAGPPGVARVDGPPPPVAPPPGVAHMDGPPPPVAPPPGVAHMDGPPPPVAGPPGVARVDGPPPPVAGPPGVARVDGPPPPVAGPPGVAHMDGPPPPVAGPPGVARVDGPPPPVAPPPGVAHMDGPPPPVAGPPGVAPTQRAPGARPPPWRSAARANTRSVASAGWRVFGRVGSGLRRLRPVRARIESPPLGRV